MQTEYERALTQKRMIALGKWCEEKGLVGSDETKAFLAGFDSAMTSECGDYEIHHQVWGGFAGKEMKLIWDTRTER